VPRIHDRSRANGKPPVNGLAFNAWLGKSYLIPPKIYFVIPRDDETIINPRIIGITESVTTDKLNGTERNNIEYTMDTKE